MRMTKLSTNLKDEFAETKLLAILEDCFADSDRLSQADYYFRDKLRNYWKDEPIETWSRCVSLSLDVEFQRRLTNNLNSRYPMEDPYEIQIFPSVIAYGLVSETIERITSNTIANINLAASTEDLFKLREAINSAKASAKTLCEDYYLYREDEKTRITYNDFECNSYYLANTCLVINCNGASQSGGPIDCLVKIANAICVGEFALDLIEKYPHVDSVSLAINKATFGAKGANLLALQDAATQLKPFLERVGVEFEVRDFILLPVSEYDNHKLDPANSTHVKSAYEWIANRRVMIRSSAVYSEDGDHLGAGVYSSFLLPEAASFELLCEVIGKVYQSVDSSLAKEYRRQINFTGDEKMCVVIHLYVDPGYRGRSGHINTVRPQMPEICDVVSQFRTIPEYLSGNSSYISNSSSEVVPLYKSTIKEQLVGKHNSDAALVLPSDHKSNFPPHKACKLGKLGILLEMYFQCPLQLEYVYADNVINFVQARPLPASWVNAAVVNFPDQEDYLWRGESFGVMDQVLEILSDDQENCRRSGLVIIDSGCMASQNPAWLEAVLPKKGAVWILRPSEEMRGHIESRCAERGILVITGKLLADHMEDYEIREDLINRLWNVYGEDPTDWLFDNLSRKPKILYPSEHMQRLRVVSNGLEARIYKTSELIESNSE